MRVIKNWHLFGILAIATVFFLCSADCGHAFEDQEKRAKGLASYTMGVVYDLQGLTEKAVEQYQEASAYADHYAVHLRLGADYARLGKFDEAIKEFKLVLETDPANVQARYILALIYSSLREFDKATAEYESILTSFSKAEPENLEIYGYLAQLYYSQKEYDKAITQYENIVSLNPLNADAVFLLGALYLEKGERSKAKEMFLKAMKIDPTQDNCLNSLGYLYAEDGINLDEAQRYVEKALEIDPKNGAYLDSLGWIYFKKKDYEKALIYLKEADSFLKDPVIYEHLGDVYYARGEKENARKYWTLSLEMLPGQVEVKDKLKSLE